MSTSTSLLENRLFGIIAFLILLVIGFGLAAPNFLNFANGNTIALNGAILVVVACAQAIVVLTRNYDLSVGSTVALAAFVGFDLVRRLPEAGPVMLLAPVLIGGLCGAINGWLVAYGRVPAVVATLGTMSVYRGLAFLYAGGGQIDQKDLPAWTNLAVSGHVAGIATLPIIAVVVVAACALLLQRLPVGRQIYAVGSNPQAAEYFGLNTKRVVFCAYLLCGFLVGLAAFLFGARSSWIVPYLAQGLELSALAAVVIGGVSVLGGSGSVVGAAVGAIAIVTIDNGLILIGASDFTRQFVQGLAIVVAVVIDAVVQRRVSVLLKTMRLRGGSA